MSEALQVHHPQCPFCHTPVAPSDEKVACDKCMSWQHQACWEEHGRCAACRATVRLARTPHVEHLELTPRLRRLPLPEVEAPFELDPPDPELAAYIRAQIHGSPSPEPSLQETRPIPWDCPRCRLPLTASSYEDTHVQSCRQCLGYWLSELACCEIAIRRDAYFSASERRTVLNWALGIYEGEIHHDLPCPMCSTSLQPAPFKALMPYRCWGHGVWLDTGDLKRIQIVVESSRSRLNELLRSLRS